MDTNSIFDALNEMKKKKEENNEDYNYKVTDTGNTEKVKEPGNKVNKDKKDKLKQKRKNSYKQNMQKLEDPEDEDKEKEKTDKGGEENANVALSNDEILNLKNILKALKVPENIETALEDEDFEAVYEYLEDNYGIKFEEENIEIEESKEEEDSTGAGDTDDIKGSKLEEKEEVPEDSDVLKLEDEVKLGVMEDGFATADTSKWDISLMVYEGGEDELSFRAISLDEDEEIIKLNMRLDEESVDTNIYMEVEEMKRLLK